MISKNLVTHSLILCLFISSTTTADEPPRSLHRPPCKELVFFVHETLYNGRNYENATAVTVASPRLGNDALVSFPYNFGDLVVIDDPITLDNNLHSPHVGRAQGIYANDQRSSYGAWVGFSFVFNSTEYVGTLNFAGADLAMKKTRDISVIGGTGDFHMARGVATLMTDASEDDGYSRVRVDVKLYECWCDY